MKTSTTQRLLRGLVPAAVLAAVLGFIAGAENRLAAAESCFPFYAFESGCNRNGASYEAQAKLLKELGYEGIGFTGTQHIPEMLKALDAEGLKMYMTYVNACVDADKPPYDPGLKTCLEQLKGRDTLISLFVTGGKASADTSDDRAVAILREISDLAEPNGIRIALYPHVGCYVARVQDALRLVKKVDRKNIGTGFNLCHFLKLDDGKQLEARLQEAMPYLFTVSINGADDGDTNQLNWDRLIQTLDRGSFDVARVLKTLKQSDYKGAVGLQCYAIPGSGREVLSHSMAGWRKLCEQVGK
jgi:sugar phosphate isomerase/epimerase